MHCRLYQRHNEYREVFNKLFEKIRERGTEKALICIVGDVVHSKTDMSPELVDLVSYFLKGCADLCPTLIIPGNHDFNAANPHRMDSLTPIIEALDHPKIMYSKHSEVIKIGDISFSHLSIMDHPRDWRTAIYVEGDKKVALSMGS